MPINSKNKGTQYEQKIARELREIGFESCLTSRHASKLLDDMKVDFTCTDPFNIQAKAVEKGLSYHSTLEEMPKDANYNLIFHKKNRKPELVVMLKEDFYELARMLIAEKVIKP
jgi:hypothetical protein